MAKSPELLIPIPPRIIEPAPKPRERLIEIPRSALFIGSTEDEWRKMTEPWIGSSSEWPTVVRAWIGTDEGVWRQWYPDEEAVTVKLLMVEGFNNGFSPQSWQQGYWTCEWPTQSYPTPWAGDYSWGTRKTVPVPATALDAADCFFCGMDYNPYSRTLMAIVGESNAGYPGYGYKYWAFRSSDYGDTWTEIAEITGSAPVGGYTASDTWFWNWGSAAWNQGFPPGDTVRYVGGDTWVWVLAEYGHYMLSDDDGDTWRTPGGSLLEDGTALRQAVYMDFQYYWYAGQYPYNLNVNWPYHTTDGPWRSLCGTPPSTRTAVFGNYSPMVAYVEGIPANQWHMAAEWYSQETGWRGGIPPFTASGTQYELYAGGHEATHVFVPGTATNKWLYVGTRSGSNEMVAIIPDEDFRPSTALQAIGQKAFIVSSTYQSDIYTGWAYGSKPSAWPLTAGQLRVTPHPTTSGAWRTWIMQGQTGIALFESLVYSDDQGTTWTSQADYSQPAATMAQWLGNGQHPVFWYQHGVGSRNVYVTDIAWHPEDPLTLLSIGRIEGTVGYGWVQAASYDGGNTWDDYVELTDPGSGGPVRAQRLIVMYASDDARETPDQSREAIANQRVILHAPAVTTGDKASVGMAATVVHAPAVTATLGGPNRTVDAPALVAHAPAVATSPTFRRLGSVRVLLHAPAVDVPARAVGVVYVVGHAPAVTATLAPSINHYRTVASGLLVAYAPAIGVQADQTANVGSAAHVLHAPAATLPVTSRQVDVAAAAWHAPAVTVTTQSTTSAGAASAVATAPAVSVTAGQTASVGSVAAVAMAPAPTLSYDQTIAVDTARQLARAPELRDAYVENERAVGGAGWIMRAPALRDAYVEGERVIRIAPTVLHAPLVTTSTGVEEAGGAIAESAIAGQGVAG